MRDTQRRAAIAVVVSAVGSVVGIAGAGHAYLREWSRAFAWFSFVLGAGFVLIGFFADPETATLSTLPPHVVGPIVLLFVLNTADAYYVARRSERVDATDGEEPSCPSCGRDLDPDLSFCPWCAGSRDEVRTGDCE